MTARQGFEIIYEGGTPVFVFRTKTSQKGPSSKHKEPFYNPAMELNRDLSVLVAQWFVHTAGKQVHLLDGLAASGIRGIRFAHETTGDFHVTINDSNEKAFLLMKKNINHTCLPNITAIHKDLNLVLSENRYDYIDIDPFGSPVYFVDAALRAVYNNGIIACTATDAAPLCGVFPLVCLRRYGARPLHSYMMHEVGLRILLGFICREAAKYDKGIEPLLSYATDHYFRVYVQIHRGKRYANTSMETFSIISPKQGGISSLTGNQDIGPLWTGKLFNTTVVKELRTQLFKKELRTKNTLWKLLSLFEEEADTLPFFYSTEHLASSMKCSSPSMEQLFERIHSKGFTVVRTHFSPIGFKTNASTEEVLKVFRELNKT